MGTCLVVVLSVLGSLALTPVVKHVAWSLEVVSRPDGIRRLHAQPTPLWGGMGVCAGLLLGVAAMLLWGRFGGLTISYLSVGLATSAGLLCLVGMIDDRHMLSARRKLAGQILAVLPIVVVGLNVERIDLLGWELTLGWWTIPWTIGALLLGINALNLLDGSDGLASTVGIVTSLALAATAAIEGSPEVMLLALILAGALAGFLVYNLPPARIYLGDGGSTLIGFVLTALALQLSQTKPAAASLPVVGLFLFVPLLDTSLAILRRLLKGQAIWSGDRSHLHHQLKDRGLSSGGVLLVLGGLCLASGLAATAAVFWQQELGALLVMGIVTAWLVRRRWIANQEWNLLADRMAQWTGVRAPRSLPWPERPEPLHVFQPHPARTARDEASHAVAEEAAKHERRAA